MWKVAYVKGARGNWIGCTRSDTMGLDYFKWKFTMVNSNEPTHSNVIYIIIIISSVLLIMALIAILFVIAITYMRRRLRNDKRGNYKFNN